MDKYGLAVGFDKANTSLMSRYRLPIQVMQVAQGPSGTGESTLEELCRVPENPPDIDGGPNNARLAFGPTGFPKDMSASDFCGPGIIVNAISGVITVLSFALSDPNTTTKICLNRPNQQKLWRIAGSRKISLPTHAQIDNFPEGEGY